MNTKHITHVLLPCLLVWETSRAQTTQLTIDRDTGPTRVGVIGDSGHDYSLEVSSGGMGPNTWEPMLTATLTNSHWTWLDSATALLSQRFYRVAKLPNSAPSVVATDFRLLDHLGRSHQLNYYLPDASVHSMVLIFTGNNCDKVHDMISAIKSLRDQFASAGVGFWMIDADAADNRSNVVAEVTAQGIDLPVLHDAAQLVAGEYGATAMPEAVVLRKVSENSTPNWEVIYRGAIDDRLGPAPLDTTQYYLSNALASLVANQPVIISRARSDGCPVPYAPPQTASYSTDIAPLLQTKCVRCHSPGNIAPWAMTNFEIVQAYASSIKEKVLTGAMPPWHADPYYGIFANDFSLTPKEAAMLVQWINAGALRGAGPDPLADSASPPTNYPIAWPAELGQPDQVLSIPAQSIPATGIVDYRYLNVTTTFPTDTWIRAAVVRPGNRRVVHHSLVFFGSDSFFKGLLGFFTGYVPGYDPGAAPEGTAKLLPKGTVLQFQMHYITTGQPETDQTEIGLYLSPTPPARVLQTRSAPNILFSIPPNSTETQATADYTFAKDSLLYEMAPHMHLRGAWFRYEAVYPDRTREVLLSVPHYEFHWQNLYRLAQPKFLPAGTQLICTGAWDNSPLNLENPDPSATVTFGEQTFNEMFIGYFNFAEVP